ncbi:TonB-dependent receptor [Anaeromyxobacter terrae]|uniref:TonB-dependent receptor n=1 Tax=Anaeromyxobacter terrae TaxID=2925406 RepID=UPI001F59BE5E|nr:TonB-dependent receptor [Anaeromyxobacter sp. SG22]
MRKKLLRLLRIAPLALLFASIASAQTTGTVLGVVTDASTGKPVAGAVIIATSPALQGEQTAVTDNNGSFRLPLLPPGDYKLAVQLDGYKPAERADITVRLDKTIRANLAVVPEAVQMEEQVVRTGAAPVVNIGAAESGAVISREFVASIPVGRTVEAVSATVPTASSDLYGVGFAGSQSPENAYILDGMNVTDPVYGTFGGNPTAQNPQTTLITNFIQEVDVKTGGFMPEYGRATGGVLNMVTKSGSNEFHGSAFGNLTPRFMFQPTGRTAGAAGEAVAWRFKPDEGAYDLDLGFELGGPIQKDKLWFYAGFAPVVTKRTTERFLRSNVLETDPGASGCVAGADPLGYGRCIDAAGNYEQNAIAGTSKIIDTGRTTYQLTGKLTYLLDENNNFTLSAFGLPSHEKRYSMNGADSRRTTESTDNIFDVIGRYGGKFLDKRLIMEVVGGWHGSTSVDDPTGYQASTSAVEWYTNLGVSGFEQPGDTLAACGTGTAARAQCTAFGYITGGNGFLNDSSANRFAGRVNATYLFDVFGSHATKGGLDVERSTYGITKRYGGGAYFRASPSSNRFSVFRGYGVVNGGTPDPVFGTIAPAGTLPIGPSGIDQFNSIDTNSQTTSTAAYLQDSWQLPVANLTVNYGLRWEMQNMSNRDNPQDNGFTISNNWAPRVQAIWDFTGNGRGKVAGSWGRFYYMMPLDMGDRAFGLEDNLRYRLQANTCGNYATTAGVGNYGAFDATSVGLGKCAIQTRASADGTPMDAFQSGGFTPVDPNLNATYVDQFGGQLEYEVLSDLSLGLEYQGRRQGDTIEDMSSDDGVNYYIGNPGTGKPFTINGTTYDPVNVTTFDVMTGREVQVKFPKPERSYDAMTVFVRKNFSQNWQGSASYTYSYLRGNLAGPYREEDGQIDPGITSEYDLASLMANKVGRLPGDRPHQVKLFGSYTFNFGPRFNLSAGAAYTGMSGNPVNALGADGGAGDYGDGQAFILPRGMAGRSPFLHNVDLKGSLSYVITPPYALQFSVDVFNVFNTEEVRATDENYTFDAVQPIVGINCDTSAASAGNPVAKLQSDCSDVKYLKTVDGRPVNVNPNWGKAAPGVNSFQAPLSLRFGVALSF